MDQFLSWLPTMLVWVVACNLALSGLKMGLEKIKDVTASQVDNKLYAAVSKVVAVLDKIVDWASANVDHKK